MESGSVDPVHFDVIGAEWDVEERALAELGALALPTDLDRTASGRAERTWSTASTYRPPSTRDATRRRRPTELVAALTSFRGALLAVSHDRRFLHRLGIDVTLRMGLDQSLTRIDLA